MTEQSVREYKMQQNEWVSQKMASASNGWTKTVQDKFEQAEAILNPPTHTKTYHEFPVSSPKGVRRHSAQYWKSLYLQRTEQLEIKTTSEIKIENVPGLLLTKKSFKSCF